MTEIELLINQFILDAGKLYTLPELYQQLDAKINSDRVSIDEIGELLSTDAALCVKILRIANSSLYGFRAEITTITRALSLIGLKEIKNLILMDTVAQNFNKKDKYNAIQMEDFWRRSIYIALIAKRLAIINNHPQPDRLFICGIMSRIGQLVACITRAKEVLLIIHQQQNNPDESEFSIESNTLGFTYNEVSAKLLEHWKVPKEITIPLQMLHQPLNLTHEVSESYSQDIFILNMATIYSYLLEQEDNQTLEDNGQNAGENDPAIATADMYFNKVDNKINQALMIDPEIIDNILFEIELDALDILSIVFPDSMSIY